MTQLQQWTFADHRPPGDGPWNSEPDKAQWIDEATGLDCLIVRSPFTGALCGYAGVPPGHPWHGVNYPDLPRVDVHGGLTFSRLCQEGPGGRGVCHVPGPGRPAGVWWLGFDCAHSFDLSPASDAQLGLPPDLRGVYRDFAYVQRECAELAAQVARAGGQGE